ncbi:hypothetical protein HYH03_013364 [Edaphochlamys debaryana]|uniref:cDENN domain-containing protein n=1 Tax=Edaphochlamys debaryana TaxID=47281 RepID=A0A835XWE3_9CHLO|nr:hypothetical protein HYH03_013364 [Edaphochlamys debaryana]|eukprot:KAG2488060.1 hypothetical protein HYH03_013364 [Edaphochlamys debaryana]
MLSILSGGIGGAGGSTAAVAKKDEPDKSSSTFLKFGKSLAGMFKTKKEPEKLPTAGVSINPEALTAQKREWMDSQAEAVQLTLATWPEHLFEHFFVIGMPPDVEITQVAEDLCEQERCRQEEGSMDGSSGGPQPGGGPSSASQHHQYDKAPRPAYTPQVLFRHPPTKAAPLSDQELVDLCFPHKVSPYRLRRSPSMSSLHEVVYGRQAASRDDQCFIFLLKVGTSLPLYGICCAVPEMLHRPPHLARHLYPACRAPFRSVMIAAPRVYCLLSHYPFFDLHFQVLNVILGMERLHRTIDFNSEQDAAAAAAASGAGAYRVSAATLMGLGAAAPPPPVPLAAAAAAGPASPPQHTTTAVTAPVASVPVPPSAAAAAVAAAAAAAASRGSSAGGACAGPRRYCRDCAAAIAEMYPGLAQQPVGSPGGGAAVAGGAVAAPTAAAAELLPPGAAWRRVASGRHQLRPSGGGAGAGAGGGGTSGGSAGGGATEAEPAAAGALAGMSSRRLSDPGTAPPSGQASPRWSPRPSVDTTTATAAAAAAGFRSQRASVSGAGGPGPSRLSDAGAGMGPAEGPQPSGKCQVCGRSLAAPAEAMTSVAEQGLLEEVAVALEGALDKLAQLPKAVAAGMQEAAAAAAATLRIGGDANPTATAAAGGYVRAASKSRGTLSTGRSLVLPGAGSDGPSGGEAAAAATAAAAPGTRRHESRLSSDMGSPRAALPTAPSVAAASAAEKMSALAAKVRSSLKALPLTLSGGGPGLAAAVAAVAAAGGGGGAPPRRSGGGGVAGPNSGGAGAAGLLRRHSHDGSGAGTPDGLVRHERFEDAVDVPILPPPPPPPPTVQVAASPPAAQPVAAAAAARKGAFASAVAAATAAAGDASGQSPTPPVPQPQPPPPPPPPLPPSVFSTAAAATAAALTNQYGSGLFAGWPQGEASGVMGAGDELRGLSLVQQLMLSVKLPTTGSPSLPTSPAATGALASTSRRGGGGGGGGGGLAGLFGPVAEEERLGETPNSPTPVPVKAATIAGGGGGGGAGGGGSGPRKGWDFLQRLGRPQRQRSKSCSPERGRRAGGGGSAAVSATTNDGSSGGDDTPTVSYSRSGAAAATTTAGATADASSDGASESAAAAPPLAAAAPPKLPSPLPPMNTPFAAPDAAELLRGTITLPPMPSLPTDVDVSSPVANGPSAAAAQSAMTVDVNGDTAQPNHPRQMLPPLSGTVSVASAGAAAAAREASSGGGGGGGTDGGAASPMSFYSAADTAAADVIAGVNGSGGGGSGMTNPYESATASGDAAGDANLSSPSRRRQQERRLSVDVLLPAGSATGDVVPVRMAGASSSSAPLAPPTPLSAPSPAAAAPAAAAAADQRPPLRGGGASGSAGPSRFSRGHLLASSTASGGAAPAGGDDSADGAATAAAAAAAARQPLSGRSSGSLASPPPAGVAVTGVEMAHHFSPRRALDQLYDHPVITPGEQLTLRFGGVATLQYVRPVLGRRYTVVGPPRAIAGYAEAELAEGLQHWTTAVLCRSLSLDNLLLLLTAALLERQLVFFCPHISVLSCCVLGLLPLLRPFAWQSLLLPVTPLSMVGFLEAPVPFVLGVQYKTSDVMARCSSLVRVNVYKDQVKNAGAALPSLPGLKRLAAALGPHHAALRRLLLERQGAGPGAGSSGGGGAPAGAAGAGGPGGARGHGEATASDGGRSLRALLPAELAATSSFLGILTEHLAAMCGDLRPHVITNVGLHKRTGVLMKESLLEVVLAKDRPFVRQFVDTQMFAVWSDAMISAYFEGSFATSDYPHTAESAEQR